MDARIELDELIGKYLRCGNPINGPIESLNRKVKDLKRQGRGYRNFEHFRTRFLYATRDTPVINGVTDYNPVTYYDMEEE